MSESVKWVGTGIKNFVLPDDKNANSARILFLIKISFASLSVV